jgi:hypothetical protein
VDVAGDKGKGKQRFIVRKCGLFSGPEQVEKYYDQLRSHYTKAKVLAESEARCVCLRSASSPFFFFSFTFLPLISSFRMNEEKKKNSFNKLLYVLCAGGVSAVLGVC